MKIITRIRVSLYCRREMNRFLPVFLVYMILLFVSANAWSRVFDVRHTPFSHYGSYMAVMLEDDPATGEEGIYIRDISGERMWGWKGVFRLEVLKRCGEHEWASELALQYCEMCRAAGFPENFSALDGSPLRDTGYSWTVDVFFALAHEYLREN
jgi:hypothetical protein